MTLAELKEAVALLGFERSLSDIDENAERNFFHCVNQALWAVSRLRPRTGVYQIRHYPFRNLLTCSEYYHKGGVCLEISAFGAKSYTFYVYGSGSCTICDGTNKTALSWTGETLGRRFRGLLSGESCRLSFFGDFGYPICAVAMYDDRKSNLVTDIPDFSPFISYDISASVQDFLSLDGFVVGGNTSAYRIEDNRLVCIDRNATGIYCVRYRKKAPSVSENDAPSATLGIDEDLCCLLPLLCASYLCLEDDANRAAYYAQLYREQYALIRAGEHPCGNAAIISSNGW